MTDLGDVLMQTLHGINDGFAHAKSDFDNVLGEIRHAIQKVRSGLDVVAIEQDKAPTGTIYQLTLVLGEKSQSLGFYKISSSGYPILYGSSSSDISIGHYSRKPLMNKNELREHFVEMLQNKNSPLIVQIAYLLRQ